MYFLSQSFPQGLKPDIFLSFAARINPCPFKAGEDAFALTDELVFYRANALSSL
jgi:hypothetical protein